MKTVRTYAAIIMFALGFASFTSGCWLAYQLSSDHPRQPDNLRGLVYPVKANGVAYVSAVESTQIAILTYGWFAAAIGFALAPKKETMRYFLTDQSQIMPLNNAVIDDAYLSKSHRFLLWIASFIISYLLIYLFSGRMASVLVQSGFILHL